MHLHFEYEIYEVNYRNYANHAFVPFFSLKIKITLSDQLHAIHALSSTLIGAYDALTGFSPLVSMAFFFCNDTISYDGNL